MWFREERVRLYAVAVDRSSHTPCSSYTRHSSAKYRRRHVLRVPRPNIIVTITIQCAATRATELRRRRRPLYITDIGPGPAGRLHGGLNRSTAVRVSFFISRVHAEVTLPRDDGRRM